ncbi:MAG: homoserine dehydrogenase [Chloroflexi bacterium]|nr:homoserine dehydrogenase [Chloroflexota bacterium]
MKLILIGFGVVGQGFAKILLEKGDDLGARHDFSAQIVGVVTASKGQLYHPDGLDIAHLLRTAETGSFADYPESELLQRDWDANDMILRGSADVLLEASPTNLQTAQPALATCHLALDQGLHIVLANKGPVALDYGGLRAKADARGLHMRYEATVMAGTPTMHLAQDALAGCAIRSARGILNGTTNYILTQMESGMTYAEALAQAQALGYAETDPTADVEGWDAAGKVLILANALFGSSLTMRDLDVRGITDISPEDIDQARQSSLRYKLIAEATPVGGMVSPQRLPVSDPLASVGGSTNAITLDTDLLGEITLIGAGAGKLETGYALLSDLMAIQRET